MDVLRIMLSQRGVSTSVPETIQTPADLGSLVTTVVKFDKVVVYNVSKPRVYEKDVEMMIRFSESIGGELSIAIVPLPPSDKIQDYVRKFSDKVQLFHQGQLQFDITTHRKVSPHRILNDDEKKAFMEKYHVKDPFSQMPMIDSQDMMAKWIGAKPGDIVEIMRKSETSGATPYYRVCVSDVTL